jgi:hypothetical protein
MTDRLPEYDEPAREVQERAAERPEREHAPPPLDDPGPAPEARPDRAPEAPADRPPEADERVLYRADTRPPEEIFANGFQAKGDNMDLAQHAAQNPPDSGYVSTSKDYASARDFGDASGADNVYKVSADGIDVNQTLGDDSPFPWENEIAVPHGIPAEDVEGAWGADGWTSNPRYRR